VGGQRVDRLRKPVVTSCVVAGHGPLCTEMAATSYAWQRCGPLGAEVVAAGEHFAGTFWRGRWRGRRGDPEENHWAVLMWIDSGR
jgi:hypothetical protein